METLKAIEELNTRSDKVTIAVKAGRYEEAKGVADEDRLRELKAYSGVAVASFAAPDLGQSMLHFWGNT